MPDNLFLLKGEDSLTKMNLAQFANEDIFQKILARFPDLLTDADFGEGTPRRWMLIGREAGVTDKEGGSARWSLDHLFLDQDGVPTLVEVKRATDTRARREVVAQMLDYAANAVNWWRIEEIVKLFEESCKEQELDPLECLGNLLGTSAPDAESFWRSVQANLSSGRIRLIFVADHIAPELERIVEFLNEQMNPATVVALELRPFQSGADRILSPRLIGVTSRAAAQKAVSKTPSAASVEEWFQTELSPSAPLAAIHRFSDFVHKIGAKYQVTGRSLAVDCPLAGEIFRIAYVRPSGQASLSLYTLSKTEAFKSDEARKTLCETFEAQGFRLAGQSLQSERNFDLPSTENHEKWNKLEKLFEALLHKLSEAQAIQPIRAVS
jgi:hypothetical protein